MSARSAPPLTRRLEWLAAALAIAGIFLNCTVGVTNDQQIMLYYASRWLDGARLYIDLVEVNAWQTFVYYGASVKLMALTGWPIAAAHTALTGAIVLAIVLICRRVIKASAFDTLKQAILLLMTVVVLLYLPMLGAAYADRDYMMVALIFPWLLLHLLPSAMPCRLGLRLVIGVLAGIGICFKLYDALVPLLVLAAACLAERSLTPLRRADTLAMGLTAMLIQTFVYWHYPAYWQDMVPMAAASYAVICKEWIGRIHADIFGSLLLLMLSLGLSRAENRRLWPVWLAFTLIFALNGGWAYTYFLLFGPYTLLLVLAMLQSPLLRTRECYIALIAWGIFLALFAIGSAHMDYRQTLPPKLSQALHQEISDQQDFAYIGLDIWGANLVTIGQRPHQLFPVDQLWMLNWLIMHEKDQPLPPRHAWLRQKLMDYFYTTMIERRPDWVIINESPAKHLLPNYFNLLEFFLSNPRNREAFSAYHKVLTTDDCSPQLVNMCRFTFWKRD